VRYAHRFAAKKADPVFPEWNNLKDKLILAVEERKAQRLAYEAEERIHERREFVAAGWHSCVATCVADKDCDKDLPMPMMGDVLADPDLAKCVAEDIDAVAMDTAEVKAACHRFYATLPAWRESIVKALATLAGSPDDKTVVDLAAFKCARAGCEAELLWPSMLEHRCLRCEWTEHKNPETAASSVVLRTVEYNYQQTLYIAQAFDIAKIEYGKERTEWIRAALDNLKDREILIDIQPLSHIKLDKLGKRFRTTTNTYDGPRKWGAIVRNGLLGCRLVPSARAGHTVSATRSRPGSGHAADQAPHPRRPADPR
jgi:hypothetical protein